MAKKTIWLINVYAMPPEYEQRIQTLKRAQYLYNNGYEVYIIGGSFLHNTSINLISDKRLYLANKYDGINFIHIRNTSYTNSKILRIYSLIEFYIRLFSVSKFVKKPDVISLCAAIPFSNIVYYLAKRLKAKLVLDVVDLWPESFVALGLLSKYNPILWFAYKAEKWIYRKAEKIVFSMEGGADYIKEKKWDTESGGPINLNKVKYINNGVDLNDFNNNKNNFTIDDADLNNESLFKIIYLGSIRLANGVELILDAAKYLEHIPNIKFLIYGNGPERNNLQKRIESENIKNVILKQEWVELKYVPYILTKSSLNLLNYTKNPIFKFGGSQSKSFQYMASGKPICSNIKMAYCPINKFNLGIAKEFNNAKEYSDAILSIYNLSESNYQELCNNALLASKKYDYEYLTNKYIEYCLNE
jgi:glycosyltransferase involved in cell wall biosynthesis